MRNREHEFKAVKNVISKGGDPVYDYRIHNENGEEIFAKINRIKYSFICVVMYKGNVDGYNFGSEKTALPPKFIPAGSEILLIEINNC